MFGHQDDHHDQQHDDAAVPQSTTDAAFAADMGHDSPAPDAVNPAMPTDTAMFGAPLPAADDSTVTPASTDTNDETAAEPQDRHDAPAGAGDTNGLLDIKTQALQQLSPLVGHLDQSPEEKFRTTMMMIQASDDQSLVKTAYEAAQAISDEKTKAQALLDIVNEINYFTHQNGNDSES